MPSLLAAVLASVTVGDEVDALIERAPLLLLVVSLGLAAEAVAVIPVVPAVDTVTMQAAVSVPVSYSAALPAAAPAPAVVWVFIAALSFLPLC